MLKPLGTRIIVLAEKASTETKGGILVAGADEKPVSGIVKAVGSGRYTDKGDLLPLEVKEGDKVLFPKYAGSVIKHEGQEFLAMQESDIIAVVFE